ncbi:MAG: hypothetical protein RJB66_503 [Pseudomonadota bacterium]|jgi:hypothetical protein
MFENQRGESLVSVLLAAAILTIIISGIISMQVNQQRETRYLSEKLAVLGLESILVPNLSSGSICVFELNNPSKLTFNSTNTTTVAAAKILVSAIHAAPSSLAPIIAKSNDIKPISPETPSVFVKQIYLTDFVGSGSTYTANWKISFDSNKLVRALSPISIPVVLKVDNANPTSTKITGCNKPNEPQTILGTNPTCPSGQSWIARRWITPSCSNYGGACTLYQGWSGAPPSCESCVDWEKCHICYSSKWDAAQCIPNPI